MKNTTEDEKQQEDPVFEVRTSVFARQLRSPILQLAEYNECKAKFHLPVGGVATNPYKLYVQTPEVMQPLIMALPGVEAVGVTTDKTQAEQPPPVLAVAAPKLDLAPKPPTPSPYQDHMSKNWEEKK